MVENYSGTIIFRCDGSFKRGLGHLSRCAVLAECFSPSRCLFLIHPDPVAQAFLEEKSLEFRLLPPTGECGQEAGDIALFAVESGANKVVLDKKDNSRDLLEALKERDLIIIDLEDKGPGRALADILIDQHVWPGMSEEEVVGPVYCGFGPDWALLDPLYAELHELRKKKRTRGRKKQRVSEVLVACGGSDPGGLATRILKSLDKQNEPFRITVAMGPGVQNTQLACKKHALEVLRNPRSLAGLLCRSDLAFVSGGITMSESLCLGVPTVVAPQHEEQFANAEQFGSEGALLLAPPPEDPGFAVSLEVITAEVLGDRNLRESIARAAWALIDGKGVERLKKILEKFDIKSVCN